MAGSHAPSKSHGRNGRSLFFRRYCGAGCGFGCGLRYYAVEGGGGEQASVDGNNAAHCEAGGAAMPGAACVCAFEDVVRGRGGGEEAMSLVVIADGGEVAMRQSGEDVLPGIAAVGGAEG